MKHWKSQVIKGKKEFRLNPEKYLCMFETHIEQGPILEEAGNDIGVVDCVLGMFNYRIHFRVRQHMQEHFRWQKEKMRYLPHQKQSVIYTKR